MTESFDGIAIKHPDGLIDPYSYHWCYPGDEEFHGNEELEDLARETGRSIAALLAEGHSIVRVRLVECAPQPTGAM